MLFMCHSWLELCWNLQEGWELKLLHLLSTSLTISELKCNADMKSYIFLDITSHIPEDRILHSHCCYNLKSHITQIWQMPGHSQCPHWISVKYRSPNLYHVTYINVFRSNSCAFQFMSNIMKNIVYFMCTWCITETDIMCNDSLCTAITITKGLNVQWLIYMQIKESLMKIRNLVMEL
jgi:hypothetical protein